MARSSTSYASKWKSGETAVIRVPKVLKEDILDYAERLDKNPNGSALLQENQTEYRLQSDSVHRLNPENPVNVASVPQRSPFRYPGGKTWLVPFIRKWLLQHKRRPDLFIEPFAGGAIASLTVAFERLANHVIMAEIEEGVAAVWRTILTGQAEWLAEQILRFQMTQERVRASLRADLNGNPVPCRKKAFLTILRNRVQRGGIMAPGAGLVKSGENGKGLNSRWYPETLARRIRDIAMNREHLTFVDGDGFKLIHDYQAEERAVFFLDPPYTTAAKRLYRNWQVDHRQLFELLSKVKGDFILTYDQSKEIAHLAKEFGFQAKPIVMKTTHHTMKIELIIGRDMEWLNDQ